MRKFREISTAFHITQWHRLPVTTKLSTMHRMRRIFILAILLLMSVQVSWAAVSNYCQHETGAATQHIGHHEHEHHEGEEKSKGAPYSVIDDDCASCQLGGMGIMPMSASTLPFGVILSQSVFVPSSFLSSQGSERPERPKWMCAV